MFTRSLMQPTVKNAAHSCLFRTSSNFFILTFNTGPKAIIFEGKLKQSEKLTSVCEFDFASHFREEQTFTQEDVHVTLFEISFIWLERMTERWVWSKTNREREGSNQRKVIIFRWAWGGKVFWVHSLIRPGQLLITWLLVCTMSYCWGLSWLSEETQSFSVRKKLFRPIHKAGV